MVYSEGEVKRISLDSTLESTIFLIDSINQQRKDLYSLTETIITLEQSKNKGLLMESTETQVSTEVKDNASEVLVNLIKKIAGFIWKLIKNAVLYIKSKLIKDNAKLLKVNEDKYDSIHTDELENFVYEWREPTPLLLSYLRNNQTKSDDINLIWEEAIQYTSTAMNASKSIGVIQLGDDPQTIFQNLASKIITSNNTGSFAYSAETFRSAYPLKLLDYKRKYRGIEYTRKTLIKDSMVPNKVVDKLESSLREQQKSVEKFLEKIDQIRHLPLNTESLHVIDTCRNIVNVLNNMAIVITNSTIESINVYTSQCRNVFLKMIAFANLHEES